MEYDWACRVNKEAFLGCLEAKGSLTLVIILFRYKQDGA